MARMVSKMFLVSAVLALAAPTVVLAAPKTPPAKKAPAPKAPPPKKAPPPVTPEHKKALADLMGGFKFGTSKDDVIAVFSKQLDERYAEKIKATTDVQVQDRLRKDKKNEVAQLQASYVEFDAKPSPWDVSIVEDEAAHNTGEAMLERWENQGGKNQRRFFFFYEGKLWKMFVSLDVSILPEDKKNFATLQSVMESKYGAGDVDVEAGRITWRTDEFDVHAQDKLKSYDALAVVIEDPKVRKDVEAMRATKAPPKKETSSVIKAVIDPDHTDHPDTKANNNAIDDVIRAQGGTPPKRK